MRFQKRAHNPLLVAAGFDKTDEVVPWLGRKRSAAGLWVISFLGPQPSVV